MKLKFICISLILIIFCGCESQFQFEQKSTNRLLPDKQTIDFLVSQGFKRDQIELTGDGIVIDGDQILKLEAVHTAMRKVGQSRSSHFRTLFIANKVKAGFITVYIDPNVPGRWITAINDAMAAWKKLNKTFNPSGASNVFFIRSYSANANIAITMGHLDADRIGMSSFPDSNGSVGSSIQISNDPFIISSLNPAQLKGVMMHELGHTLGLRHTDWQCNSEPTDSYGYYYIPGTPFLCDYQSIMSSQSSGGAVNTDFSADDKLAISQLWPAQ